MTIERNELGRNLTIATSNKLNAVSQVGNDNIRHSIYSTGCKDHWYFFGLMILVNQITLNINLKKNY